MNRSTGGNHLTGEQSPYLLQHADNPVDWYPWGDEAFSKAKEEDKPIFLSIGYSTCHWCHVMERESFENEDVAALLNEHFVSIKVDREERPEIDSYYMTVSQLLTGSGGWPLTIVMTPEKEPFFAATYIPPQRLGKRPGMLDLLPALHGAWIDKRGEVVSSVSEIMRALKSAVSPDPGDSGLSAEQHAAAFDYLSRNYDDENGGFGGAPKFPSSHNLIFLLRYWHRTGSAKALEMAGSTLSHMRSGGIYDHIGFGFHRYSTDSRWHLPHFEKMLYDQAMISWAYLEAFQATGKPEFRQTAEEIFTYALRDLQSPEGGFYTAEDADSDGAEGLFYLWSAAELRRILGEDYEDTAIAFGIVEEGNHVDEARRENTGLNLFESCGPPPSNWDELRNRLFSVREERVHPLKDDKVLTDWNGLMISALAKGGSILGDDRYMEAARKAANFILERLSGGDGHLLHRYRHGVAGVPGYLDDYAFFVQGLIDLYQATFEIRYLVESVRLTDLMIELFLDTSNGGFFSDAKDADSLPFRQKDSADNAIPSGNSAAFGNLTRLSGLTGKTTYLEHAVNIGKAFSGFIARYPHGNAMMLAWHELLLKGPVEVILTGIPESNETVAMVKSARTIYVPEMVLLNKPPEGTQLLDEIAPFTRGYQPTGSRATAYVCRNFNCNLPTNDVEEMVTQITAGEG